jgi:2-polyprenyl-6-methoxyphenol hydroxylase-like FAD-dependent oxidoreductase
MYDVIVIGGGVIGGAVLRELSRYQLKACMLEKQDDVCMGQSKANSGIVHAGFDAVPNTLKAKFNVLGNVMMPDYTAELGVKYKNNRSLVLAFSEEELKTLEHPSLVCRYRTEFDTLEGCLRVTNIHYRGLVYYVYANALVWGAFYDGNGLSW